jgi:predicted neutral ceramidase superfamily lipid hydrolase
VIDEKDLYLGYLNLAIFTAIEYLFFVAAFLVLIHTKSLRLIIKIVSIVFLIFCLVSIIIFNENDHFDSVQSSLSSILIISFCIFYFYEKLNETQTNFIYSNFHFWIVLSFLIYLAATLFLYGYVSSLDKDTADEWWSINGISNIIKNILFSIAIVNQTKPPSIRQQPRFSDF